jgi:hypothetical protein
MIKYKTIQDWEKEKSEYVIITDMIWSISA